MDRHRRHRPVVCSTSSAARHPDDVDAGRRLDAPAPGPRGRTAFDGEELAERAFAVAADAAPRHPRHPRSRSSTSRSFAAAATRSAPGPRQRVPPHTRRPRDARLLRAPQRDLHGRPLRRLPASDLDQTAGHGTPIMLTFPTDAPWVPLRILSLGLDGSELVVADVFLLTDDEPDLLAGGPGLSLERSEAAYASLLDDLRSDVGMEWVPEQMWFTYLRGRRRGPRPRLRPRRARPTLDDDDAAPTPAYRPGGPFRLRTPTPSSRSGRLSPAPSSPSPSLVVLLAGTQRTHPCLASLHRSAASAFPSAFGHWSPRRGYAVEAIRLRADALGPWRGAGRCRHRAQPVRPRDVAGAGGHARASSSCRTTTPSTTSSSSATRTSTSATPPAPSGGIRPCPAMSSVAPGDQDPDLLRVHRGRHHRLLLPPPRPRRVRHAGHHRGRPGRLTRLSGQGEGGVHHDKEATASSRTWRCRSTSASVVAGHIRAMLWNGVRRMPRLTR